VSWSSKRQHTVSRSSAEGEYQVVANAIAETSWLHQLLQKHHKPIQKATLIYCDNLSDVYLSTNLIQHQHTKHIEIYLHFVRDKVATGSVHVLYVPTTLLYYRSNCGGVLAERIDCIFIAHSMRGALPLLAHVIYAFHV
jgi:hypothetical protein